MAIYYLDGTTLTNSTAIFDDPELTICAADGVYSNGAISRELLNCVLLPQQICAECTVPPVPCGTGINPPSGSTGLYNLTFDAGSNVGAIVIYFNPQRVPDGIRVQYNGVFYNALSSPLEGLRQSTSGVADAFTILGGAAETCVPATPSTLPYDYKDGFSNGVWDVGTPTPQNVTINTGDDIRGGLNVFSTIVIPKTTATPNTLNVQVLGPCLGTQWMIEVNCPTALPSFSSSVNQGSSLGCVAETETYYFARQKGMSNPFPIITNWVFSDSSGEFVLSDGNYVMSNSDVITVVSGIVTAIVACASLP